VIVAAQLFGVGVNVHQPLRRHRSGNQPITAGRDLAETRAQHDQQIGSLDALGQFGIDTDADIARVVLMLVIEQILGAKLTTDRNLLRLDETT
jgi:hypothetical protein